MNAKVLVCTDPSGLEHDTGPMHPESPERLRALEPVFAALPAERFLRVESARPATEEELLRVHSAGHLERVREGCAAGPGYIDPDTHVGPASWDAALRAAGGTIDAALAVARGEARRALCAYRPPGHHAEPGRSLGFCLLCNIALAARALQEEGLAAKVAIVDIDVHHGNGTQAAFWEDPTVLYASCHQSPLFPGTGARGEVGAGPGRGYTLNRPLTPGSGDEQLLHWLEGELSQRLRVYRPDFLLVSIGFDAHAADPMAMLECTTEGFARASAILVGLAEELCGGRLVSSLEGGYDLPALAESTLAHLAALSA